jgi:hypothetical protein
MTHDAWPGYRPSVKKGLSGSVKALRAQFAMFRDGTQMQTLHKLYRRQRKLEWLSNRQGPSTAKYRHPAECADLIAENDLDEPVVRHWLLAPRAHLSTLLAITVFAPALARCLLLHWPCGDQGSSSRPSRQRLSSSPAARSQLLLICRQRTSFCRLWDSGRGSSRGRRSQSSWHR